MFRKALIALGATAVIGAAALTPTAASAHWHGWHGGWHHYHYGYGFYPAYYGGSCYVVRRGWHRYTVCD
jgi:ABC-type sugar transport system substrate-binding protein